MNHANRSFTIVDNGDFGRTTEMLKKLSTKFYLRRLNELAQEGVDALAAATPKDTGKTAASWRYEIVERDGTYAIVYSNTNVIDEWANVAILLQYGHATRHGGWVEGIDYINPALRPVFNKIADKVWKEVCGA